MPAPHAAGRPVRPPLRLAFRSSSTGCIVRSSSTTAALPRRRAHRCARGPRRRVSDFVHLAIVLPGRGPLPSPRPPPETGPALEPASAGRAAVTRTTRRRRCRGRAQRHTPSGTSCIHGDPPRGPLGRTRRPRLHRTEDGRQSPTWTASPIVSTRNDRRISSGARRGRVRCRPGLGGSATSLRSARG